MHQNQIQIAAPTPRVLEWGIRIFISKKLPRDAASAWRSTALSPMLHLLQSIFLNTVIKITSQNEKLILSFPSSNPSPQFPTHFRFFRGSPKTKYKFLKMRYKAVDHRAFQTNKLSRLINSATRSFP